MLKGASAGLGISPHETVSDMKELYVRYMHGAQILHFRCISRNDCIYPVTSVIRVLRHQYTRINLTCRAFCKAREVIHCGVSMSASCSTKVSQNLTEDMMRVIIRPCEFQQIMQLFRCPGAHIMEARQPARPKKANLLDPPGVYTTSSPATSLAHSPPICITFARKHQ